MSDLVNKWMTWASECEEDAKNADREDSIRLKTEARVLRRCANELHADMEASNKKFGQFY